MIGLSAAANSDRRFKVLQGERSGGHSRFWKRATAWGFLLVALAASSAGLCREPVGGAPAETPAPLDHLLQHTPRIYSGGEPSGKDAFAAIAELGVRTVVSVDGIRPDVETAETHGLRYVHIPIGYDGISCEAGRSLANLIKTAPGPFYIHCHHGKHRGPAAAAICCIAGGQMGGEEALKVLRQAGTSRDYDGLWRDVRSFRPPAEDEPLPPLRSVAEVGSLAGAMATIARAWDRLERCRDAGWRPPPDHPDLVPEQEALLIEESFHEAIRRRDRDGGEHARLLDAMRRSESDAVQLRRSLADGDHEAAAERMRSLKSRCQRCHETFRH